MSDCVKGSLNVKEGGDSRMAARKGFFDMFGEPYDMPHAVSTFSETCLAYWKYTPFLEEMLQSVFDQSLVHCA